MTRRIDAIVVRRDGSVEMRYTDPVEGVVPLTWGGAAMGFANRRHFAEYCAEREEHLREHLDLMRVIRAQKADPTLGVTFRDTLAAQPAAPDF